MSNVFTTLSLPLQPPPFSSDYPYRPPRIDDTFYQAVIPEIVTRKPLSSSSKACHGSGPRSIYSLQTAPPVLVSYTAPLTLKDSRRAKRGEKRTPAQRLRDIISKINATSAFAAPPEQCIWNPTAAFAVASPEESASIAYFYPTSERSFPSHFS